MEETVARNIQSHRLAAAFFLGTSLALLMTTPAGGPSPHSMAPGWLGLWVASTLGSAPLGVMLLAAPAWRTVPIESRRAPALAYLTACFLGLLALTVLLVSIFDFTPVIVLAAGWGLGLAYLFIRLFPASFTQAEDLFP